MIAETNMICPFTLLVTWKNVLYQMWYMRISVTPTLLLEIMWNRTTSTPRFRRRKKKKSTPRSNSRSSNPSATIIHITCRKWSSFSTNAQIVWRRHLKSRNVFNDLLRLRSRLGVFQVCVATPHPNCEPPTLGRWSSQIRLVPIDNITLMDVF